jgi:hypothetical protein
MKDIGRAENGNRIVEMNGFEYDTFTRLRQAVEGLNSHEFWIPANEYAFRTDYDFKNVFEVITAFCTTQFFVNQLQSNLDQIKKSMNNE